MRKNSRLFLTNDFLLASLARSMKLKLSDSRGEKERLQDLGFAVIASEESALSVFPRAARTAGFTIVPTHAESAATTD